MAPSAERKGRKRTVNVTVRLEEAQQAELAEVARILKCSAPEVLRRGIASMRQQALAVQAGVGADQLLAGDELTVQAKQKALAAFERLKGDALAAKEAGVSRRTLQYWMQTDPVFSERAQESYAIGVEGVEGKLVEQAEKGNIAAIFGVLNAKHPDYGQIRTQLLQRVLGPLLDWVVKCASKYLQPADLQRFAADVGGHAESVALDACSGGKRR